MQLFSVTCPQAAIMLCYSIFLSASTFTKESEMAIVNGLIVVTKLSILFRMFPLTIQQVALNSGSVTSERNDAGSCSWNKTSGCWLGFIPWPEVKDQYLLLTHELCCLDAFLVVCEDTTAYISARQLTCMEVPAVAVFGRGSHWSLMSVEDWHVFLWQCSSGQKLLSPRLTKSSYIFHFSLPHFQLLLGRHGCMWHSSPAESRTLFRQ